MKNTMVERYGVEHNMQVDSIKYKARETNKRKQYKTFTKYSQFVKPLFTEDEFVTNGCLKWKCVECGNIFEQDKIYSTGHLTHIDKHLFDCPRCLNCYPFIQGYSNAEKSLVAFCKQYFPNLIENDRTLIKPKELDIVIPELKLAIEFNGTYWHSEQAGKDKNYHLNKTLECEKQGYRLIHIFEHEWVNKQEIIKAKLKALFGVEQERIYARKCVIKELSTQDKDIFLNQYHIQGEDKSKIKLGLFYQDELVAVMTFGKPRFNKNYGYELIRYATSKQVIGGASKLLSYFERVYKPKSIITYADRRFSQGNIYYKLGFTFLNSSGINYWWIKDDLRLSRYQTQKHKLKNILQKFDGTLTESKNLLANGFYRIFDCGNSIFIKKFK
jgi:ribosomal protein L44E